MLAFWLPVGLVFGLPEAALWRAGEYVSCQEVVERQAQPESSTLWLRGYADQDFPRYKWLGFLRHHPRVVALGSSRAMHLRAEMLGADGSSFYNLGGAVRSIADLESWTNVVPDELVPKVILLEVDVWWLNEKWAADELFTEGISKDHLDWQTHLAAVRGLVLSRRLAAVPRLLLNGHRHDRIGLRAEIVGEGFRPDGSRQTWKPPPTPIESSAHLATLDRHNIANQRVEALKRGQRPVGISRDRLAALDRVLRRLQARGVLVLGFASAFTRRFADAQEADPLSQRAWKDFHREVPRLFKERGFPFVTAPRTASLGLDDRYMWDSHHPNDTFHVYLLREMLKDPVAAAALPSALKAVEAAIASPRTNVWYPDLSVGRKLCRSGK